MGNCFGRTEELIGKVLKASAAGDRLQCVSFWTPFKTATVIYSFSKPSTM